jgi:ectoine hydroxylase-related dioxygenase (phytanoyl-CoA dioxygenase family)
MQIEEALTRLGVHDGLLSADERRTLDEQGYLVIPGVLSKAQADLLGHRLKLLAELEGADAGKEVHQEAGTARLANLVDKGNLFSLCFTHPKVLAGISHVLRNDLKLSSLNSRAALPGQGLQGLHADWGEPVKAGDYQVCNSIWLLDDFTPDNGATRAVPGTHRSGQMPSDAMKDPKADHPNQRIFVAPAGTVVVFNSHAWHGGTLNRTQKPRRAIHAYFSRRQQPQQLNQRHHLSSATIAAFSPEVRCLLDVE